MSGKARNRLAGVEWREQRVRVEPSRRNRRKE